jgi:hypothetical protein
MPQLLLLVGDASKARNDNHERLPGAFRRAGWRVTVADHDDVDIRAGALTLAGTPLIDYDLLWPLGFGRLATYFDRMQMLKNLPASRFVVSPDALIWLHGKHRWLEHMPETHTSSRAGRLLEVLTSGGDWVLKPSAGSYGRDVRLVTDGQITRAEIESHLSLCGDGYLIAQRYVPAAREGEQRTLVAGGTLIATYTRRPERAITSNLATGGQAAPGVLTPDQRALAGTLAGELHKLGAGFAAIDLVGTRLMEVNVANPGGLGTLEELGTGDFSDAVAAAILSARTRR